MAPLLTPGVVVESSLLVAGLVWCHQVLRRWRADLDELRSSSDGPTRASIVLPWLATALVAWLLAGAVIEIVGRLRG